MSSDAGPRRAGKRSRSRRRSRRSRRRRASSASGRRPARGPAPRRGRPASTSSTSRIDVGRLAGRPLDLLVARRGRSGRSSCPPRRTGAPRRAPSTTSGQVASITSSPRPAASARDRGRDAVRGEDDGGAVGHLVELLDEDGAALLEVGDDVLVVDDLLADVDGRAALRRARARRCRSRGRRRRRTSAGRRAAACAAPTARGPLGERAARRGGGCAARAVPSIAMRGSARRRPAASATTRTTASGRPAAPAASQADSMSTASAPSAWPARSAGAEDPVGRRERPDVHAQAAAAERGREQRAAGHGVRRAVLVDELGRAERRRRHGAPGRRRRRGRRRRAPARRARAPARRRCRARSGPMPVRRTDEPAGSPSASCSIRSGARTRRSRSLPAHEHARRAPSPGRRPGRGGS